MHPTNLELDTQRIVALLYRAPDQGEMRIYRVIPHSIHFGRMSFEHGSEQWILKATNVEQNTLVELPMSGIFSWSSES